MTRRRLVNLLEGLAYRKVPVIGASWAARLTEMGGAESDELIDVWVALDDWDEAGQPQDATYARVVSALTVWTFAREREMGLRS